MDIKKLTQSVDTILAVSDNQLFQLIKSIYDLYAKPSLINLDFADIQFVFRESGLARIGNAMSSGENAIENSIRTVLDSQPFKVAFSKARRVLIDITLRKTAENRLRNFC